LPSRRQSAYQYLPGNNDSSTFCRTCVCESSGRDSVRDSEDRRYRTLETRVRWTGPVMCEFSRETFRYAVSADSRLKICLAYYCRHARFSPRCRLASSIHRQLSDTCRLSSCPCFPFNISSFNFYRCKLTGLTGRPPSKRRSCLDVDTYTIAISTLHNLLLWKLMEVHDTLAERHIT
jgi:hypothetical protein